jgi:ribose 5-phosphate isomerase B
MKIAIGSDHAGYELKDFLKKLCEEKSIETVDVGGFAPEPIDYPLVAKAVAGKVLNGECNLGVVICGTGIGISISANKIKGVHCALCSEPYSAQMARKHNNANILAIGARVTGQELAAMILDSFLNTEFEGGRHARRVGLIEELEDSF